jgi:PAS domain S-box-containing protein
MDIGILKVVGSPDFCVQDSTHFIEDTLLVAILRVTYGCTAPPSPIKGPFVPMLMPHTLGIASFSRSGLRSALPWTLLLVCLACTFAAWLMLRQDLRDGTQAAFEVRAQRLADSLVGRLNDYEHLLRGAQGLFAVHGHVDPIAWKEYVGALVPMRVFSDIQFLGYAPEISARQRAGFERSRKTEIPGFSIYPPGERPLLIPVLYVEPANDINRKTLGFDMYSDPVRHNALLHAKRSGSPALTSKVILAQGAEQAHPGSGLLLFLPVYANEGLRVRSSERAVSGFVFAAFRVKDLVAGVQGESFGSMNIEVSDTAVPPPDSLLYRTGDPHNVLASNARLHKTITVPLYARTWSIDITGKPEFAEAFDTGKPLHALVGGGLISVLLFFAGWSSASKRRRAENTAHQVTQAHYQTQSQLERIIASAQEAIITIDDSQHIVLFNPAAEKIFGWTREQMLGAPLDRLIPERFRQRHHAHVNHFGATGETVRAMGSNLALFGLRANGEEFPIDASISRLTEDDHYRYTVILRDISARKAAEDALKGLLRFNEEVMSSVNEGIAVYDQDLRVVAWNRFLEVLTGQSKDYAMGKSVYDLFPDLRAMQVDVYFQRALSGEFVTSDRPLARLRGTNKYLPPAEAATSDDPGLLWTLSTFAPHCGHLGNIVGMIVTVMDVTEVTKARLRLDQTNQRLRELSTHLENVRESERTRIAREIHDDLAATLTGIKMDLTGAKSAVAEDKEKLVQRLDASLELTDAAIQSTRRIINDLRPNILDTLGVWAAIQWQTQETARRAGMACEIIIDKDVETANLSGANGTALFRMVQESLNNVWRHACASRVTICASRSNGAIRVDISDNGKGFDPAKPAETGHWGIMGMHERAQAHGGEVQLTSSAEGGTKVSISLPLD